MKRMATEWIHEFAQNHGTLNTIALLWDYGWSNEQLREFGFKMSDIDYASQLTLENSD